MKTKLPVLLACGSAAWLFSMAYAGPSPQFSNRPPPPVRPPAKIAATAPAALPKTTCAMCQTATKRGFTSLNVSGKWAPTATTTTTHTCGGCAGAIVEARGKVNDNMVRTACATAGMKCCL